MVISKLKNALENFYLIPAIFVFAVLGRIFNVVNLTLPIIAVVIMLILVLCEDAKNVLAIIFYAPFYIKDIVENPNDILFAVLIVGVVSSLVYFTVRKLKKLKEQNQIIKGKLYVPLIIVTIAYLLGGVAYEFNIVTSIVILVFSLATFLFYFIALNCIKDTYEFLGKLFVVGAVFVGFMIMFENYVKHGGIEYIFNRSQDTWVGAENVNVASIFIMLGIGGAFSLGYKTNHDRFYFLLSLVFYLFVIITYCRMVLVVSTLALIVFTILSLIKSPDKKKYLICLVAVILALAVAVVVCWNTILILIREMSYKSLLGGREELWPWCIQTFKQNIVFGVGFKINGTVPTMGEGAEHYVLAHNALLQWLTSLGLVGTICMLGYLVVKYKILLKNFFSSGLILRLLIIFIAISSLVDQAPQMDPFIYNIVIVLIASIEKLSFHKTKKEIENEKN